MSGGRFVAVGECMVELSGTDRPDLMRMAFAGDTFNTAWYARRRLPADVAVDYLTAVGTDRASQRMVDYIASCGIGTGRIGRRADRSVGLYMIELSDGERSFSYWRDRSAARTLGQDLDLLPQDFASGDCFYVSGITLAILPPADRAALIGRMRAARTAGALVAFDSNLRPRLWEDADAMRRVVTDGAGAATIALPSFEDESDHFGDTDPAATAARYRDAGAGTVVVKNGGSDVRVTGAMDLTVPVDAVVPVDTTAAGDSFNAGCLAALMTGAAMEDAVRAGCALSAAVIRGRGALVEV